MRPHKKLIVWNEAIQLVESIYLITKSFPKEEMFGLTSQMRKSAVSIVSNIAEGCARKSIQEKVQFLSISKASLSELDAQMEISLKLKFIHEIEMEKISKKLEYISSLLQGLINKSKEIVRC